MLIRAATVALERAQTKSPGWLYDELAAMTFSALAIEALCNTIGERVVVDWRSDFESASPGAKLRVLAEHLGVPYDRTKEPWAGAIELGKFRNRVAHAKPEVIVEESRVSQEEFDQRLFDAPKSKLERMISGSSATRALRTVEEIREQFIGRLSDQQRFGLTADGWTDSASIDDQDQ